jgi:hypothetical protein
VFAFTIDGGLSFVRTADSVSSDLACCHAKRQMNGRRLLILLASGAALVGVIMAAASAYWERKNPMVQNAPRLMAALRSFSRDEILHGHPMPSEISMFDLVSRGYLATNDLATFEGKNVVFFTVYNEGSAQSILASVPDGQDQFTCLLTDGSVQQFSAQRLREYRVRLPQANGLTNTAPGLSNRPGAFR